MTARPPTPPAEPEPGRRRAPGHAVILDWLEGELRSGRIQVGDKLPSERTLAERFGISRSSVREAGRVMDAMGLVRSAAGSGPRAGAIVVSEPSAALAWALRMHVATRALPVADLVTTRVLLETEAALEAAEHDVPGRGTILATAHAHLDRMDVPDLPAREFHRLDAEFHVLLSTLSGNVVLETILRSLREATIGYVEEAMADVEDWGAVRDELQRQHRDILAAAVERDGLRAAQAVREHIRWFSRFTTAGPDAAGG
ncbi:L-lactate utilization operon repressor [Micrococcus luteus NCTC 2665]|uniref:L-lactate utilization operon repressor n=2 Tax=Micrococcus luteus TaxID=1270 RepID=C5C6X4_MICLC|nr:FCD domain-containing protein [Micrococcus luteus]ACS31462.1 transcriptional regulator [Micrococcus luteus NCTC 2665]AJO56517.1 GntR family transcriptional regulator [Micrococcus luteus]QCY44720.1 FadR family transcriptional regulator [Micrococcus luteus]SQG47891.1 L-lactate utilization operon repressor [Micrococcus luteus NCTC 2665]